MESSWPGNSLPEHKGEAAHTISGECERLFCDKLSVMLRGERRLARQESLGMDACQATWQNHNIGQEQKQIQQWLEVWDYTGDAIYRGFVKDVSSERTLFVFFENGALGNGLKSGYAILCALFSSHIWKHTTICPVVILCSEHYESH